MDTWQYVTSHVGTIHLARETEGIVWSKTVTLCGKTVNDDEWQRGDETASGYRSTCNACRAAAHLSKKPTE